jgi:hypothetical protein
VGVNVTMKAIIPEEWRVAPEDQLATSVKMASALGAGLFWIETGEATGELAGHHALSFEEDMGRQVAAVNTLIRYYGPNYERGPWPDIRAMIEWFWRRFPGCEVLYGGDEEIGVMTPEALNDINNWYLDYGHAPYQSFSFGKAHKQACPACRVDYYNFGGRGGDQFLSCPGCGRNAILYKGELKIVPKHVATHNHLKALDALLH